MPDLDYDESDEDCSDDDYPGNFRPYPTYFPVKPDLSEKLLEALVVSYEKQMKLMEDTHQKQIEMMKQSFELQIEMMMRLHQEEKRNSKNS